MSPMRSSPKPLTGIVALLGSLVVVFGVWIINGVGYDTIWDSSPTIANWMVLLLPAGAVMLVLTVCAKGEQTQQLNSLAQRLAVG